MIIIRFHSGSLQNQQHQIQQLKQQLHQSNKKYEEAVREKGNYQNII